MIDFNKLEKNNIKMLGIMVRYNRTKQGFSLRDLAKITNISHTLISNFEKGTVIPHSDTIKDIFSKLDLTFYDSPEISKKFIKYYNKIFHHLLFYEYREAAILIAEIEVDRNIYENSVEIINFAIIRCLYYTMTDIFASDKDQLIKEYGVVLDFFSPAQKQLYFFIKGLDFLSKELYKDSRENFEKALSMGDADLDLLINEHYVITLSKSGKLVDAWRIATESIEKFELETNYVRAMRLRTRIAYDYIRIIKYEDAIAIYNKVLRYAEKFNVLDLVNRCNTYLGYISILQGDFKSGKKFLDKVLPPFAKIYYYLRFDLVVRKNSEEEFLKLYNEYISYEWVQKSPKTRRFFEMIFMRYNEKNMDKKKYVKNAKELIELGFESDDLQLIEVASGMLSEFYKKERHYKDALEVNNRYLQHLKYGIKQAI